MHGGVYLNFIGGHAVTWVNVEEWWLCHKGVPLSFYRIGGETTLLPFSRFPEGTLPSNQYRRSLSALLAPLQDFPRSSPSLFLSFTLSWAASNIFLSSPSRPWINYSPTLNIWTFCAGMGPPSRDRPQKGRERMISIDRRVTWMGVVVQPSCHFWTIYYILRRERKKETEFYRSFLTMIKYERETVRNWWKSACWSSFFPITGRLIFASRWRWWNQAVSIMSSVVFRAIHRVS